MSADRPQSTPGGSRELLALAVPLVLSNGFLTAQITLDRLMLSWYGPSEVAASFPAAMLFWLPFALFQGTALYVTTFVAQYTGAGRPHRVGPAVWQGLHFSLATGLLFTLLYPLAPAYVAAGGHEASLQALESAYLRPLCFAALPMLITATVGSFFAGRGSPWTVLLINGVGTVVNAALAYLLIFGHHGCPRLGIEGAGWATVVGSWAAAVTALAMFWRPKFRRAFNTLAGWHPERELFARLMKYGGPAGLQMALDVFTFTIFTMLVGQIGPATAAAVSIAITFNLLTFLPMYGMGQAVAIMVGQRLGEGRADLAERSTHLGMRWALGYMAVVAVIFVAYPGPLIELFRSNPDLADGGAAPVPWEDVAVLIPPLLVLIAVYSLADAANVVYACALRGAGDTRFVTWLTFALAWPLMVLPTYVVVRAGGSVLLAWCFISFYVLVIAVCFWLRFRAGHWKSMRVIEAVVVESDSVERDEPAELGQVSTAR